jgi:hypothetical protein
VSILESREANVTLMDLRHATELLHNPVRVGTALANLQQPVITLTIGLEAEPLANDEILRRNTNRSGTDRFTMRRRKIQMFRHL